MNLTDQIESDLAASVAAKPSLPLPVAPFEHYMLADHRPIYPMCPLVRFQFSGRFDRANFTNAVQRALDRHPLLRANISGQVDARTAKLSWVNAANPAPPIDWGNEGDPLAFVAGSCIDLWSETGIRFCVRESGDSTVLWLQFHHSCSDLAGILRFMEDVLIAYSHLNMRPGGQPKWRDLDYRRLSQRDQRSGWKRRILATPWDLARIWAFFRVKPVPLTVPTPQEVVPDNSQYLPAFCSHWFETHELDSLRSIAKKEHCTINDLLLRDLFIALFRWNHLNGQPDLADQLRIGVAVNLRATDDFQIPAANVVSMVFLDRDLATIARSQTLLQGIHKEMAHIKRWKLGLAMIRALRLAALIPGGIRKRVAGEDCLATTFFSNFGPAFADSPLPRQEGYMVAGDVVLKKVEFALPFRPQSHALFGALTYASQLNLTMTYNPSVLDQKNADRLFEVFLTKVKQTLERPSQIGPGAAAGPGEFDMLALQNLAPVIVGE